MKQPHVKARITPAMKRDLLGAFPSNWCDPMLTGEKKLLGPPPWGCPDIERLVNGIKAELEKRIAKYVRQP